MSRATLFTIAILAILSASAAFALADDSDALWTYGDDGLGAWTIEFDANGGSGGYTQKVLSGATVYFPTERAGEHDYDAIAKAGYVLAGWSTSRTASEPSFAPGSACPGTPASTYYAVWKPMTYNNGQYTSPHYLTTTKSVFRYSTETSNGTGNHGQDAIFWTFESAYDQDSYNGINVEVTGPGGYRVIKTGVTLFTDSPHNLIGGGLEVGFFTIRYSNATVTVEGSPQIAGLYELKFSYGSTEGTLFVSAYDPATDPSYICSVTWQDNLVGIGPLGTAVKLPGKSPDVENHSGWEITDQGAQSTYALGAAYTVLKRETVLAGASYTIDILEYVGIIAFNAMGGHTTAQLAVPVMREGGYGALMSETGISKDGYTFMGWNASGDSRDLIYPAGYLYDADGAYTELKAVWIAGSPAKCNISFAGKNGDSDTLKLVNSFLYASPKHGYDAAGYDLLGWSRTSGAQSPEVKPGAGIRVSGHADWHAIYSPHNYTHTIAYVTNGGQGPESVEVTYTTAIQTFRLWDEDSAAEGGVWWEGHALDGWALSETGSASYSPGGWFTIKKTMDGGRTALYAVWREDSQPPSETHRYTMTFNANGGYNAPKTITDDSPADECEITVPLGIPTREGYDFLGWSSDPAAGQGISVTADPSLAPGESVTLTVGSPSIALYAVWAAKHSGEDGTVLVTFKNGASTVMWTRIDIGDRLDSPSTNPPDDGYALAGWCTTGGLEWNFAADSFEEDTVLRAVFVKLFHVKVDGQSVRVILDYTGIRSATIAYSDDASNPVQYSAGNAIEAHEAQPGYSGTVTISADTDRGALNAVCHFKTAEDGGGDAEGGWSMLQICAAIAAVIAILALARWYL
ncbi:MAG: InlB B-repeat-containing protein [Candidatus Methanomethylophilaceae archaeon]|nr:InlB B-repeat-containing protein [Candidatus Methanomethylophilaceae archaeon]